MNQATITASITSPSKSNDTDQSTNKIEKFKLTVTVKGLKRRCRKIDTHHFHLGHKDYNNGNFDYDALISQVRDSLNTNLKSYSNPVKISLDHVIISQDCGFTVTQWQPFSDKNVNLIVVL